MAKKVTKKTENTQVAESKQTRSHVLDGRVVAVSTPQTVTVLVERKKTHPLYGKSFTQSKRFLAHTEKKLQLGDLVQIVQTRPISAHKNFAVVRVLGRDIEAVVTEQLKEEAAEEIAEVLPSEKEEETEAAVEEVEVKPAHKRAKKEETK